MGVQAKQSDRKRQGGQADLHTFICLHVSSLPPSCTRRAGCHGSRMLSVGLLSASIICSDFSQNVRGSRTASVDDHKRTRGLLPLPCLHTPPPPTKTRRMLRITLWNFCSCCLYFFTGSARCIPNVTICFFKYLCQTLVE